MAMFGRINCSSYIIEGLSVLIIFFCIVHVWPGCVLEGHRLFRILYSLLIIDTRTKILHQTIPHDVEKEGAVEASIEGFRDNYKRQYLSCDYSWSVIEIEMLRTGTEELIVLMCCPLTAYGIERTVLVTLTGHYVHLGMIASKPYFLWFLRKESLLVHLPLVQTLDRTSQAKGHNVKV